MPKSTFYIIALIFILSGCSSSEKIPIDVQKEIKTAFDRMVDSWNGKCGDTICKDERITNIKVIKDISALNDKNIEMAWCVRYEGLEYHPINHEYVQYSDVALVTKKDFHYQAIVVKNSEICPPAVAFW